MAIPESSPITFEESLFNRALRYAGPGILLALGVGTTVRFGQADRISVILVVSGLALLAISLFDAPTRVSFDSDGVHRHCALRTQCITWGDVTAFERPPRAPSPVHGLARVAGAGDRRAGGLLVRVGPKRRYLLLGRPERPDEWDKLSVRLKSWAPAVSLPGRPAK